MRTVITDGIGFRLKSLPARGRSGMTATAHLTSCRHAGNDLQPLASLVHNLGEQAVRTKIAVGSIKPCSVCKPTMLKEA